MQVMDYQSTLLPDIQQLMDQQRAHYLDPRLEDGDTNGRTKRKSIRFGKETQLYWGLRRADHNGQ